MDPDREALKTLKVPAKAKPKPAANVVKPKPKPKVKATIAKAEKKLSPQASRIRSPRRRRSSKSSTKTC